VTPTQRTLAYLRKQGMQVGILEHWNPHVPPHGIRQDLWGFGDLLCTRTVNASDEYATFFIVQCTSGANHSARRLKILGIPEARVWVENGGGILILSWAKRGERGNVKRWTAREEWIRAEDFQR